MRAFLSKSEITGTVFAPSSKSYTLRGLISAALAKGRSELVAPLGSDDTDAAADVLSKIGVSILKKEDTWWVTGGNLKPPVGELYCRESATTMRFMTAICSLVPGKCCLTSAPSLARRPVEPLLQALRQLGVDCCQESNGVVVVNGGTFKGGVAEIPGHISSQFISALLLVSPFAKDVTNIKVTTPLESQPYVLMTLECLGKFGIRVRSSADFREFETAQQEYRPARYVIEGDWSSASYLLASGALCGEIDVSNLNTESLQGDKIILDFLENMGAHITSGDGLINVSRAKLKAIKANMADCIDLLPTMAILAAVAEGRSEFRGIERARLKESDRVSAVRQGLERMGASVTIKNDKLSITGSKLKGALIDSYGDHRIAMAFSLLGLLIGDTVIEGAECVAKTFPEFWDILKSLGGRVSLSE